MFHANMVQLLHLCPSATGVEMIWTYGLVIENCCMCNISWIRHIHGDIVHTTYIIERRKTVSYPSAKGFIHNMLTVTLPHEVWCEAHGPGDWGDQCTILHHYHSLLNNHISYPGQFWSIYSTLVTRQPIWNTPHANKVHSLLPSPPWWLGQYS